MTGVIGFIGLGNMGAPMAGRVVAAGFDLVGYDAAGTAERLPEGAAVADSVAAVVAAADTVFLSLPDGVATRSIVDDVCAASERRTTTIVDLSTVGPAVARAAAARLRPVGVAYVDGPVSGGTAGARAGTVSLMFAGSPDIFEAHRKVFASFANAFYVGAEAGQGQAMKLVNNFLSASALAATSEALAVGTAHGLDLATMLDVLNVSSGRNSATVDKFPNRVLTGSYDAGFRTALMTKDMRLYADAVALVGGRAAVARAVTELWEETDAALPGSDFTQIWQYVTRPKEA